MPPADPWSYGVESQDPETPQYLWLGGYHWTWDQTDPWTIGAGYSVRPVTAVIKTKHAGLNPMVLGSVITGTTVSRSCN